MPAGVPPGAETSTRPDALPLSAVAEKVCGEPVRVPELTTIETGPTVSGIVTKALASPWASVGSVSTETVSAPCRTRNSTSSPVTALSNASATRTTIGAVSTVPTTADWPSPEMDSSVAAAAAVTSNGAEVATCTASTLATSV